MPDLRSAAGRRLLARIAGLILLGLLLVQAARLIWQPDPRDALRDAHALFLAGRYYDALQRYALLSAERPNAETTLYLGIIRTIRNENAPAERALRRALQSDLTADQRDLGNLYLGQALAQRGSAESALRTWQLIRCADRRPCPYVGPRAILSAELALQKEDYTAAEADYQAALAFHLPADWRTLAIYRLGLLQAARTPDAALEWLAQQYAATAIPPPPDPVLTPLLTSRPAADQLVAALQADPELRPQMLGQIYLEQRMYRLAEAQFAQIDPTGPNALAAAAYAAYARWQAGDRQSGLEQLEQLVAAYPDEARPRTLLALAYITLEDPDAAHNQITAISAYAPAAPDTHLAWANWYVAQRDYVNASTAYQRALEFAAPEQKGRYASLIARFHLATTYDLCTVGLPTARIAVERLPNDPEAWAALAAIHYHCGDFAAAEQAARTALDHNAAAVDATYYLGAALEARGDRQAARVALVRAADLAPASPWRERAELILERLG